MSFELPLLLFSFSLSLKSLASSTGSLEVDSDEFSIGNHVTGSLLSLTSSDGTAKQYIPLAFRENASNAATEMLMSKRDGEKSKLVEFRNPYNLLHFHLCSHR